MCNDVRLVKVTFYFESLYMALYAIAFKYFRMMKMLAFSLGIKLFQGEDKRVSKATLSALKFCLRQALLRGGVESFSAVSNSS